MTFTTIDEIIEHYSGRGVRRVKQIEDVPVRFDQIISGMKLWDKKGKRVQKVLRVSLWEDILKNEPDQYFRIKKN